MVEDGNKTQNAGRWHRQHRPAPREGGGGAPAGSCMSSGAGASQVVALVTVLV